MQYNLYVWSVFNSDPRASLHLPWVYSRVLVSVKKHFFYLLLSCDNTREQGSRERVTIVGYSQPRHFSTVRSTRNPLEVDICMYACKYAHIRYTHKRTNTCTIIHTNAHTHMHTRAHTHTHTQDTHTHTHTYTYTYTHTRIHIYTHTQTHAHTHTCTCTHAHAHTQTYKHTHARTHTHTHTHTRHTKSLQKMQYALLWHIFENMKHTFCWVGQIRPKPSLKLTPGVLVSDREASVA